MSSTLVTTAVNAMGNKSRHHTKPSRARGEPVDVESFTTIRDDGGKVICFLVRRDAWEQPYAMWSVEVAGTVADAKRRVAGHVVIQDDWNRGGELSVPCVAGGAITETIADYLIAYYGGMSLAA